MRGTLHHGLLGGDSGTPEYLAMTGMGSDGFRVSFSVNTLEYRIGNGQWNTLEIGSQTPLVGLYETIYFRKNDPTISSTDGMGTFVITGPVLLSGNCMSLLYGDSASSYTSIGYEYAFHNLFKGNTSTIAVEDGFLPATVLSRNCYSSMFEGCIGLYNAPTLPATTLQRYCYSSMFKDCISLTDAPELPATTAVSFCYQRMFYGCTSLVNGPSRMPSITSAITADTYCFNEMFYGCTSLKRAPELPSTILSIRCYYQMFYGCIALEEAPEIPGTSIGSNCCYGMFYNCTSLKKAPSILPATSLAASCYYSMFYNCSALKTAPILPASTLQNTCYSGMFMGCSSLNYIKMLATDVSASGCLDLWVYGVASSGTFVKHPNSSITTGVYGIPSGWTVQTATS